MRTRSLVFVFAGFGLVTHLVTACSGHAVESASTPPESTGVKESAGSGNAGSGPLIGTAGASAGTSPGGAAGTIDIPGGTAGTSPGGATGEAGSAPLAGAGGATLVEPVKHRASATTCDHVRATNDPGVPATPGGGSPVLCTSHADCTAGENGRCVGNGHDGWQCTYDSCFSDADCASADGPRLCQCEGGVRSDNNVCLPGNCRVDADCGDGGYCSPSFGYCGAYSGVVGYYCHTKDDECVNDSECNPTGATPGGYCSFQSTVGHWKCDHTNCVG